MKPKRLYTKLLLSFLGVLFVTEILILGLFFATAGRSFRQFIDKQSIAKLLVFKKVVQEKIDTAPLIPLAQNNEVKKLLYTFSDLFDVKIWLTASDKTVLLKTFSTPINTMIKKTGKHKTLRDGIKLYHTSRRHLSYYAQIPIKMSDNFYTLHIYLKKEHGRKPEGVFLFGLLTIGIIIAILIVPLARIITRRVNRLNQAALEFADGNLNCRTSIKGQDEIAELGNSFNFMADKLEKMIQGNKELVANISHELRSPLTRIRVSNELIQERLDPISGKGIKRYVQNIDHEIETLDDLIDKILKLSKMNLQEASLSPEPLDFHLILTDIIKKYTPSLTLKKLTIKNKINGPIMMNTDKKILISILSNLMDNAIKYTKENGTIQMTVIRPEEDAITFSIINTYPALDDIELKKIFEPFHRINGSVNPGSGLGLTIVKKLIKQCNGSIVAKNSKTGLTFEIQFSNQRVTG